MGSIEVLTYGNYCGIFLGGMSYTNYVVTNTIQGYAEGVGNSFFRQFRGKCCEEQKRTKSQLRFSTTFHYFAKHFGVQRHKIATFFQKILEYPLHPFGTLLTFF
jgi:hypothetical protein